MITLALDASTTAVGWAVFEDADLRKSGVYLPDAEPDPWKRIHQIGQWLHHCRARWSADAIAYELATGAHGNMHTDRVLGALEYEVRCVVYMGSATEWPCEFYTVTASQVQRRDYPNKNNLELARQIKGAALDKDNPGDEADALGVFFAAWGKIKEERMAEMEEKR